MVRLGTMGSDSDREVTLWSVSWSDGKDDADSNTVTLTLRDLWVLNKGYKAWLPCLHHTQGSHATDNLSPPVPVTPHPMFQIHHWLTLRITIALKPAPLFPAKIPNISEQEWDILMESRADSWISLKVNYLFVFKPLNVGVVFFLQQQQLK